LSVDEYNRIAPLVNSKVYLKKYKSPDRDTNLADFRKTQEAVSLTAGGNAAMPYAKGYAPTDFYWIVGKPLYNNSGSPQFLDEVTSLELAERFNDYLTQPTVINPVYQVVNDDTYPYAFLCYPSTLDTIYIDYYRKPNTPFLDYYVNTTTLITTYLTEGQDPYTVTTGSLYRTGAIGTFTSITVDWEWEDTELPLILSFFLQELGIQLPDQLLLEAGIKEEKEN
jgi:hypothetical protein